MSSRQLRKLQQQRELERAKLEDKSDVEERTSGSEGESIEAPAKNKPNLFSNFTALQTEQQEEVEEVEEEEEEVNEAANDAKHQVEHEKPRIEHFTPQSLGTKLKKSKRKKKKLKQVEQNRQVLDPPPSGSGGQQDEIEAALRELQLKRGSVSTTAAKPELTVRPEFVRICELLGINTQHLKVANEMRNLFGRTSVENHDDAGGQVRRGARRRQRAAQRQIDLETALKGQHAPGKGLPDLTLRRNTFIQGKDDWPKAGTEGLTMEISKDLRSYNGIVVFKFVHSKAYDLVQQQFQGFVEMGDPQNLIGLLQRNPYNISLLLQVSKIAKDQTDHALSSDLVERALFTFGRASQSLFTTKLAEGKARLEFERPENREFWLAGYQYIRSLIMKGTYKTALEWAKLLLALDPENDPYCMLLMIHHLALRSFESQFLLDVYENTVLAEWSTIQGRMSPSVALAAMQLKEAAKARTLLKRSIQRLPWLFRRLFQEINLNNPPPSIWGAEARTDAENLFSEMYIRQTKDLWNTPEATALLVEVAHASDKLSYQSLPILGNESIGLNVARFVYLDNTPALMALIPSQLLHRSNNSDSDPLPPDQNLFSWDSQRMLSARSGNYRGTYRLSRDTMADSRTLLVWGRKHTNKDEEPSESEIREFIENELARREAMALVADSNDEAEGVHSEDDSEDDEAVAQARAGGPRRLFEYFFGTRNQGHAEQVEDAQNEVAPDLHEPRQENESGDD